MKVALLATLLTTTFSVLSSAWTTEDHEIFRLHDDVIAHEGPDATFYSFVGVSKKAAIDEINRVYRRKTTRLHPDKARQSFISNYAKTHGDKGQNKKRPSEREIAAFHKEASERFARLGVVANILRGPDRERYDFFLEHGFPKWRGTGYYYQRYRPGVGTVLVGLFIVLGGVAHYGALHLSWKRQRSFVQSYIKEARRLAYGNQMVVPGIDNAAPIAVNGFGSNGGNNGSPSSMAMNRKQKRMQEKENKKNAKRGVTADDVGNPTEPQLISGPVGSKRRVVAENGKVLIVDSAGNVFLEETTEEGETHEYLIDASEIQQPTIHDTLVVKLPMWAWRRTVGQYLQKKAGPPALDESDVVDDEIEPALQTATASNLNGETRKRKSKARRG